MDALGNLSIQDREDITASAQHAVRLMSFNQIYKVLGTERELAELPVPQNGDRKRHRDATSLDDGQWLSLQPHLWALLTAEMALTTVHDRLFC